MTQDVISECQSEISQLRSNLTGIIRGKDDIVEYVMMALFSAGNILLEDVPGVGKTTLAKALAKSLDAEFSRIQFTPDLLPSDILGGSIYNPKSGEFSFRPGPIFANIVLADEINRASPRTQSALLEVMTEVQATVEGVSYPLKNPFIVIATENPIEFHGTYPLPESQLDRFIVRLELGYPDEEKELEIVHSHRTNDPLQDLQPVIDCDNVTRIQALVGEIGIEESVLKYIVSITRGTRNDPRLSLGASPRGTLMLCRACRALALLRNRTFVIPDDARELAVPVLRHRIVLESKAKYNGQEAAGILEDLVDTIPIPV